MPVSDIASGALVGTQTTSDLFAGHAPVVTGFAPSLVASIVKYQVVALTATGITTFVSGTHTAAQAVIAAQPVSAIGQAVPYFSGGYFNHAVLTWPAALDTYEKRKHFMSGTPIFIGKVAPGGTSAS